MHVYETVGVTVLASHMFGMCTMYIINTSVQVLLLSLAGPGSRTTPSVRAGLNEENKMNPMKFFEWWD